MLRFKTFLCYGWFFCDILAEIGLIESLVVVFSKIVFVRVRINEINLYRSINCMDINKSGGQEFFSISLARLLALPIETNKAQMAMTYNFVILILIYNSNIILKPLFSAYGKKKA